MSFLPIRVLVIEEHPFKRLVATQVFREVGCEEVAAVAAVVAAVELLERTGPVDIALCNLKDEGAHGLRAVIGPGRESRSTANGGARAAQPPAGLSTTSSRR